MLFEKHDQERKGFLTHAQAQRALQSLTRPPKDGSAKPAVHVAGPADARDPSTGELHMAKEWFIQLFLTMP